MYGNIGASCSRRIKREVARVPDLSYAAWYDVEHDRISDDIECFQELIVQADLRAPEILEVGSGTARVLARLAAAGYAVTGVEPSEAMRSRGARRLATLPERVSRRVRVLAGDAERLPLGDDERFDLGILSLNTLAHLLSVEARQRALGELAAHLRPGALLLLDLDIAGMRRLAETAGQLWCLGTWPLPENGAVTLSHFVAVSSSASPGLLQLTHFYDIHEQGGEVRRTISNMSLALLSKGEVEVALRFAGFAVDEVYGNYDLSAWEEAAPRAIFLARRPSV
jgi:SAM-dependent methyltransferase